MSNTITAYFKGRTGVAEAVYQNDYGIVMEFDGIYLPAHFDCYFSVPGSDTATAAVGADNRVAIPNSVLGNSGNMSVHIPLHTGANDSEVEYVAYFKVIGRARPEDDGTPAQMTAIEQALALLSQPITNIEEIVNEALSFTGDTFAEMKQDLQNDFDEYTETLEGDLANWKGGVDADVATCLHAVGSPLVASTVAGMTDNTKIYVYTGSETGYTAGNWYYWNGSAWTSGGVYNSTALNTDTTLLVSGAAADAKVTGEKLIDLKADLTKNANETVDFSIRSNDLLEKGSVNLIDYFTLEAGGINSEGLDINSGTYPKRLRSSDYLRIDGTAYVSVTHNYYRLIFFAYDADGNYLSQIQNDDNGDVLYNSNGMFANAPVTFDKTKRYRVMIWNPKDTSVNADADYVTITQTNNRLADFDYYKETSLEPFLDTFLPFRIGSFVTSDTAEFDDNLLLLTRCAVKFKISKPTRIVLSDPEYAFMLYAQNPSDFSYTPTAWQHGEYSISDTTKIYYMLVKNDNISDLTSYVSYVSSIIHLRYSDKNIFEICYPRYRGLMSTVGDSYTAAERWQPTAIKDLCMDNYEVTAVIGGMLTGMYTSISNVDLDSEVVTIWFGTNDYSNNRLLGDVTTPKADGTTTPQETYFWGALKYVCEWLGTNLPTAKILFITHTQRWGTTADLQFIENNGYNSRGFIKNNLGYSLEDYTNAVCECASLYGYDYLDLFHMSGVNKFNGAAFYESDLLHPTSASGIKIGHMIADKLKSIK